jgi:hypothetical protein
MPMAHGEWRMAERFGNDRPVVVGAIISMQTSFKPKNPLTPTWFSRPFQEPVG